VLISFEGVDGCGKSTQVSLLERRLAKTGWDLLLVREPGGTALSERIRDLLLQKVLDVSAFAELMLFSAARAQLVAEVIRPALESGRIVICDRFTDSTLAYQGGGRGAADIDWLRELNKRVTGGLVPDRTYYLAIDPSTAKARSRMRAGTGEDRMESSGKDFFDRVVDAYEALAAAEPGRIRRIDGAATPEAVHELIWADVVGAQSARNRPRPGG